MPHPFTHQWDARSERTTYDVYCHICGFCWDEQDPGVSFRFVDHVWECYDEAACFERRAFTEHLQPGRRG